MSEIEFKRQVDTIGFRDYGSAECVRAELSGAYRRFVLTEDERLKRLPDVLRHAKAGMKKFKQLHGPVGEGQS